MSGVPSPRERFEVAICDVKTALDSGDAAKLETAIHDLGVIAWNLSHAISAGLDLSEWAAHRRLIRRPPED